MTPCPHCKAPLDDGARFCGSCGKASVPTESYASAPETIDPALRMIGKEIAGRYRITAKLGEGGMGAVFRAEQISLKRQVAVKLLRTEVSGNASLAARFNAEAEAVAKLSHPNTVNIYDFGRDGDGTLFIAMEFVEGKSLRSVLTGGPLQPRRALYIAQQVAASLIDAHANKIVHRDLKPDNVMLQERGKQKDVARVLDFGIAKLRDEGRVTQAAMTQAGDMLGTPQYMAPEQIRGGDVDGRVDVYALGCMIYEMITGRMPFEADTVMGLLTKHLMEQPVPPSVRRPDLRIAPQLDSLALAGMIKAAEGRPATMEQYQEMIVRTMASLPADPVVHVSAQQAVPTPMAYSAMPPQPVMPVAQPQYTPPTSPYAPAPPTQPQTPPTFGQQHQMPPPTGVRPPQPSGGGWKLWVIGGVVLLVVFAIVGIAASQRHDDKKVKDAHEAEEHGDDDDHEEPHEDKQPDKPTDPKDDPWSHKGSADSPGFTPIPAGVLITAPGFKPVESTALKQSYVNVTTKSAIVVVPLDASADTLLAQAVNFTKGSDFVFQEQGRLDSGGLTRDALWFTGTVNGLPMVAVFVLYIEPHYRIGIAFATPAELFAGDPEATKKLIEDGFQKFVRIP